MTNEQIVRQCKEKEQELLDKYFGGLVKEAARERSEEIGKYTKDMPLVIEAEYRCFLEELWKECAPEELKGKPLVLEEQELRKLMTDSSHCWFHLVENNRSCGSWHIRLEQKTMGRCRQKNETGGQPTG